MKTHAMVLLLVAQQWANVTLVGLARAVYLHHI
jgi:hypothetical protein